MATTEVRRDNRGLWIALAVIAVLAILAILFFANNRQETADLDATAPATVAADVGDATAGAADAATAAAREAAADASAAAANARDATIDAGDNVTVRVGPDGTSVSGTASTDN